MCFCGLSDLEEICVRNGIGVSPDAPSLSQDQQPQPRIHPLIHRMQIFRMRLLHFVNSLNNYIMTRVACVFQAMF